MKKYNILPMALSFTLMLGTYPSASIFASEAPASQAASDYVLSTTTLYDHSRNAAYPMGTTMTLEQVEGNYFKGHAAIDDLTADNSVKSYISGRNSFTFVIRYKTTSDRQEYQQILANGDHAFGVRDYDWDNSTSVTLEVVPYDTGWNANLKYAHPDTDAYIGSEHTLITGYDSQSNQVFATLDGVQISSVSFPDNSIGIAESNYPLTLGGCPETGRDSTYLFKSIKLFEGVKTADEIASLNASDAKLWMDADNNPVMPEEPDIPTPVELNYSQLETLYTDCENASIEQFVDNDAWTTFIARREQAADLLADKNAEDHDQELINTTAEELNESWLAVRLIASVETNPLPVTE